MIVKKQEKHEVPIIDIFLIGQTVASFAMELNASVEGSYESKVDSLLAVMTLDQKIGQMNQIAGNMQTGPLIADQNKTERIRRGEVGAILNVKGASEIAELQRLALESPVGIPMMFGLDVVHGFRTIFPLPIAEASSFDLAAIEQSARMAAREATSSGLNWTFAPMVDVCRDARWGRAFEGAGEDPFYGARVAQARVRGFQGDDLKSPYTMLACAKHFAAYGAPEAGKDYNTVDMSWGHFYNYYMPPYKACADVEVGTFMNAFNVFNSIPSTANKMLVNGILRNKWDFKGFVVSDWGSINELLTHGYAENMSDAAQKAISAGCDMDMVSGYYLKSLKTLVEQGIVDEKLIDDAVRRILIKKYELGLFEDPFKYCDTLRVEKPRDFDPFGQTGLPPLATI